MILETQQLTLEPYDSKRLASLCGQLDEHLRQIENRLGVHISNRGNFFQLTGDNAAVIAAKDLLRVLYAETSGGSDLIPDHIHLAIQERHMQKSPYDKQLDDKYSEQKVLQLTQLQAKKSKSDASETVLTTQELQQAKDIVLQGQDLTVRAGRSHIKPRGDKQRSYVKKIQSLDVNFGTGPAGTGKTFLAVACAISALEQGEVRKIVLVRPAVEAGEKLGFLPGDMVEKVNPYLRPLYDALYEMLGFETVHKYMDREVIEIAPLAYMRGRTLNHAFIILDESQNTTVQQMKMFLTRLGFGSQAVITGDCTQIDLARSVESGLTHAIEVLSEVEGIGFTHFSASDVVRHSLVQNIVEAYESYELQQGQPKGADPKDLS